MVHKWIFIGKINTMSIIFKINEMNNKLILFCFALLFVIIQFSAEAIIKLPAIFCDNMVLQQKSEVSIWGKAGERKSVNISTTWSQKEYTTKANSDGFWNLKIQTPEAGGPYSIIISDGETLTISGVLIGEVWLCSGQSNIAMTMKGYYNQPVDGGNYAIANSKNANIRLFTISQNRKTSPQYSFEGSWKECNPENIAKFSAVAYYFGRKLQSLLGVPVGLISASWRGSAIEQWIREESLMQFDWVMMSQDDVSSRNLYNTLYNGMIHPITGYKIKGVIWYQGEANRKHPLKYEKLLQELIYSWRSEWNIGEFPFYLFQIAPYDSGDSNNSAFLRDAQRKVALKMQNVEMVSLIDIGEEHIIHPSKKELAGDRMALLAMVKTYGMKGVEYSGPVLKEMSVEGNVVKLTFNHAENGFTTYGKELENFRIAGENKHFYVANAVITWEDFSISLWSPFVDKPVAVRYAFDDFVVGELYNTEGLPASSFRTDNWKIE